MQPTIASSWVAAITQQTVVRFHIRKQTGVLKDRPFHSVKERVHRTHTHFTTTFSLRRNCAHNGLYKLIQAVKATSQKVAKDLSGLGRMWPTKFWRHRVHLLRLGAELRPVLRVDADDDDALERGELGRDKQVCLSCTSCSGDDSILAC